MYHSSHKMTLVGEGASSSVLQKPEIVHKKPTHVILGKPEDATVLRSGMANCRIYHICIVLSVVLSVFIPVRANLGRDKRIDQFVYGGSQFKKHSPAEIILMSSTGIVQPQLTDCHVDKYFIPHQEECMKVRKSADEMLGNCDKEAFFTSHQETCELLRFYIQTEQQQCNEEVYFNMEPQTCENTRKLTLERNQKCDDKIYYSEHEKICDDNRLYALQLQEQVCKEQVYYQEHAEICEKLSNEINLMTDKCQAEKFYAVHIQACENLQKDRQHKCATDLTYLSRFEAICKKNLHLTDLKHIQCSDEMTFYVQHKQSCDDNEQYYVIGKQEKCLNDREYFHHGKDECREHMHNSHLFLESCDHPTYYSMHQQVCGVQRYYVQVGQEKCNDKTFYLEHQEVCELQRFDTEDQQMKCMEENHYGQHQRTCNDNQHYYVQMRQEQCHDQEYYTKNAKICRDMQLMHNVSLLENCDNVVYHLMHTRACETQRYNTQKQQTVCHDISYVSQHQQVCDDAKAANHEVQTHCNDQEYYSQHQQTCEDTKQQQQSYILQPTDYMTPYSNTKMPYVYRTANVLPFERIPFDRRIDIIHGLPAYNRIDKRTLHFNPMPVDETPFQTYKMLPLDQTVDPFSPSIQKIYEASFPFRTFRHSSKFVKPVKANRISAHKEAKIIDRIGMQEHAEPHVLSRSELEILQELEMKQHEIDLKKQHELTHLLDQEESGGLIENLPSHVGPEFKRELDVRKWLDLKKLKDQKKTGGLSVPGIIMSYPEGTHEERQSMRGVHFGA